MNIDRLTGPPSTTTPYTSLQGWHALCVAVAVKRAYDQQGPQRSAKITPMKKFPPLCSRDWNPAPCTRTWLFRLRFVVTDFKNKGDSAPLFLSFELRARTLDTEKSLIPPQLLLTRSRRPSTGWSGRVPLPIPDEITMTIRGKQQRTYGDAAAAGQYHLRHSRISTGSTMVGKGDCTPYIPLPVTPRCGFIPPHPIPGAPHFLHPGLERARLLTVIGR